MRLTAIIPVYNDWTAVRLVLDRLDHALIGRDVDLEVVLVDDGSTEPLAPDAFAGRDFKAIDRIEVLGLRRNLGHQRAIAVALAYVEAKKGFDAVVVMDGDGEDKPEDVPRLLDRLAQEGGRKAVFAERRRRSEGVVFASFYWLYRTMHYVLTGTRVRVGNFSVVPAPLVHRLVTVAEIWNHYAAGVLRAGIPCAEVPAARGQRVAGRSRMNFVALVVHGLSAISVWGDVVGARALIGAIVVALLGLAGVGVVAGMHFVADTAIPDWAGPLSGALLFLVFQSMMFGMLFVFLALMTRKNFDFIPCRDYAHFLLDVRPVYPA